MARRVAGRFLQPVRRCLRWLRGGARLDAALDDLEAATRFLQDALSGGRMEEALSGATPYLRLFALAAGGCYLARAAATGEGEGRAALARFFAENLVSEIDHIRRGGI